MTPRILIVDDDANLLKLLAMRLDKEGYLVTEASSAEQAIPLIEAVRPSMVITDMQMTGMDGMALFELISRRYPNMPVIMLTAHGSIPAAVEATKRGMFGYLSKPFEARTLMAEVEKALANALPMSSAANDGIVTRSPQMQQVLADAQRIARNDAAALILGESGTGKELLARCIHQSSPRARGPFVALNCGAIPENLLESELFGHSKGAFTGAMRDYKGLIQQADGGTLFLDEIGDMPLSLQVKLLRVLQEKSFRTVGGSQELKVDVRVVSATHRDLEQTIKDGQFREDLFYRINVVELRLPPLRERREDIPLLVAHFLQQMGPRYDREGSTLSPNALRLLAQQPWPGNVRQLQNVIEKCLALGSDAAIPDALIERAVKAAAEEMIPFDEARRNFERDYLINLLKVTRGNVSEAAKLAKRNRSDFYTLLNRHEIDAQTFKDV